MSFFQRYELLRLLENGEARTFRARQRETQRVVLLHMLPSGPSSGKTGGNSLAQRVQEIGAGTDLLEVGEFSGLVYAVTEDVEPFPGLRVWLDKPRNAPPPPVDLIERTRSLDEQFESLFAEEKPPVKPPPPPPPPKQDPPPPAPPREEPPKREPPVKEPPAEPPAREPGEFTRMFAVPAIRPEQPLPDLLDEEKPSPKDDAPGFTAMFQAVEPPPASDPLGGATRKMEAADAGEFTSQFFAGSRAGSGAGTGAKRTDSGDDFDRFFGPGLKGDGMNIEAEQAREARTPQPDARPFAKPGKFTKVFGPGGKREAQQPEPPPRRTTTAGSVSQMFAVPDLPKPPVTQAPPADPSAPKTKGEYTRMMQAHKLEAQPPAAPPPVAAAPAAEKKANKLWLWIGIGVGVATILAVVVILLLRR